MTVAPKLPTEKEPALRASPTHRELVLVVDDDEQVLRLVRRVLERAGFECVPVPNGKSAHSAAVEWRPDLILLDLMLPGELSGSQVLERIRSEHGDEPRVLVVSALVNATTAPKLEAYGNVETLGKPFKIKELAARIQAMLDN